MMKMVVLAFFFILLIVHNLYPKGEVYYGNSSWYGDKFHGRTTASGEIYDMHKMTAAHRTLRFGTYLKVTNLHNNKTIVVKVNDRGPFKPNRILDLSKAAATKLGFIDQGLARVRVEVLNQYYDSSLSKAASYDRNSTSNINKNSNENKNYKWLKYGQNLSNALIKSKSKKRIYSKNGDTQQHISIPNRYSEPNKYSDNVSSFSTQNKPSTLPLRIFIINVQEAVKKNNIAVFKIQLGAYTNLEFAVDQQRKLAKNGISTLICLYHGEGKTFRIFSKKTYSTMNKAIKHMDKIKKIGIKAFIVEL